MTKQEKARLVFDFFKIENEASDAEYAVFHHGTHESTVIRKNTDDTWVYDYCDGTLYNQGDEGARIIENFDSFDKLLTYLVDLDS